MGVQQNIEAILSAIPADATFHERLRILAGMEAIDRDYVVEHQHGVARSAAKLALAVGFSETDAEEIRLATKMHDIGKLAIPESILRFPGRLSDGDRVVMNMHAVAGQELLGTDAPKLWHDIARYHHERYDGAGYEGLRGEDIPLAARIVQIADVHDALLEERDYKKGMPEEEALLAMTADNESPGFGRRAFDPFLLRTFIAMRLSDPSLVLSDDARHRLSAYASSDPMLDIGAAENNGGWVVKKTGHRIRYSLTDGGHRRMEEMRLPNGNLKYSHELARKGSLHVDERDFEARSLVNP